MEKRNASNSKKDYYQNSGIMTNFQEYLSPIQKVMGQPGKGLPQTTIASPAFYYAALAMVAMGQFNSNFSRT